MNKLKRNESGFSAVEVILVLVIVVLLGVVGWFVYKNQKKTTPSTATTTTKATTPTPTPTPVQTEVAQGEYVNVVQDNFTVIQVSPNKIAKTTDQAKILQALHELCEDPKNSYVTINHTTFDGNGNFKQDGSYAEINASRCNILAKTLDELGGSGSATYLHKNTSGTWIYDYSSQMGVYCKYIDGKGYPVSIIPTCYDTDAGTTTRAPK